MEYGKVNAFALDTKGSCFLCMKETNSDEDGNWAETRSTFPLKFFSRYLKLDVGGVYNVSSVSFKSSVLENADIIVPVCEDCLVFVEEFTLLYQQFDLMKLRLNGCVQKIHDVMWGAEEDISSFRNRAMKSVNPVDLITLGIVMNLRKEAIAKSSSRLKRAFPQVSVKKVTKSIPDDDTPSIVFESGQARNTNEVIFFPPSIGNKRKPLTHRKAPFSGSGHSHDSPSSVRVTYKKLPNGKFRCCLCQILILPNSRYYHTRGHQRAKLIQCPYCSSAFKDKCDVRRHLFFKHREIKFKTYKDSRLSDDKFKSLVDTVFEDFQCNRENSCSFCARKKFKSPSETICHMVRMHKEKFVPLIMAAQSNYFLESIQNSTPNVPQIHQVGKNVDPPQPTQEKRLPCSYCGLGLKSEFNRTMHVFKTHRVQLFLNYKQSHESDQDFEIRIKSSMKNFVGEDPNQGGMNKCQLCPKTYKELYLLRAHLAQHHFDNVASVLGYPVQGGGPSSALMVDDEDEPMVAFDSLVDSKIEATAGEFTVNNFLFDTIMITDEKSTPPIKLYEVPLPIAKPKPTTVKPMEKPSDPRIPIKCAVCSIVFSNNASRSFHERVVHKEIYFKKYQDPRVPREKFKELVEEIFEDYFSSQNYANSRCPICNKTAYASRKHVACHMISQHLPNLVPLIMTKQSSYFIGKGEGGAVHLPNKQSSLLNRYESPKPKSRKKFNIKKNLDNSCIKLKCCYCDKICSTRWNLRSHNIRAHWCDFLAQYKMPDESRIEFDGKLGKFIRTFILTPLDDSNGFKCKICDKKFESVTGTELHILQDHLEDMKRDLNGGVINLETRLTSVAEIESSIDVVQSAEVMEMELSIDIDDVVLPAVTEVESSIDDVVQPEVKTEQEDNVETLIIGV